MSKMSADVRIMVEAAEKASRSLLRDFGEVEQLQVSKKGPGDFVSAADKRAEDILHRELSKARPDFGFIMEEGGSIKGKDGAPVFIIDPLDGTTNFLHGIPHWCTTIAIAQNGEVQSGIVFDPIKNELFHAEKGYGAFMNKKKLRVSGRDNFEKFVATGGSPIATHKWYDQYNKQITNVLSQNMSFRRMGAAALDLAYVAAGRCDLYWETGIQIWDVAAGILMVEEAKGSVSSISKKDKSPLTSRSVMASNGIMHAKLETLLGHAEFE